MVEYSSTVGRPQEFLAAAAAVHVLEQVDGCERREPKQPERQRDGEEHRRHDAV